MITHNWNCNTVDAYPEKNGVVNLIHKVHFTVDSVSSELDAIGEAYTAKYFGAQDLNTDEVVGFVPFENLTNAQLVIWVKEAMGTTAVANIEGKLEEKINSLIAPTSIQLTIGD